MSSSSFSNVKICFFLCFIEATWKFNTLACWLVKTSHWRLFLGLVKCIFYYILTHLSSLDLPWLYLSSFHRLSLHHSGSSILHLTEAKSHWITNNTHVHTAHTLSSIRGRHLICVRHCGVKPGSVSERRAEENLINAAPREDIIELKLKNTLHWLYCLLLFIKRHMRNGFKYLCEV